MCVHTFKTLLEFQLYSVRETRERITATPRLYCLSEAECLTEVNSKSFKKPEVQLVFSLKY